CARVRGAATGFFDHW
nr:immunoglobulin heavy chain junction region [Macaca mulatta]